MPLQRSVFDNGFCSCAEAGDHLFWTTKPCTRLSTDWKTINKKKAYVKSEKPVCISCYRHESCINQTIQILVTWILFLLQRTGHLYSTDGKKIQHIVICLSFHCTYLLKREFIRKETAISRKKMIITFFNDKHARVIRRRVMKIENVNSLMMNKFLEH